MQLCRYQIMNDNGAWILEKGLLEYTEVNVHAKGYKGFHNCTYL